MWTLLNFFFSFFINIEDIPKVPLWLSSKLLALCSGLGLQMLSEIINFALGCRCSLSSSGERKLLPFANFFSLFAVFRVGEVEINFNCFGVFFKKKKRVQDKVFSSSALHLLFKHRFGRRSKWCWMAKWSSCGDEKVSSFLWLFVLSPSFVGIFLLISEWLEWCFVCNWGLVSSQLVEKFS